ncbi:MAG: hypothetical protein K0R66_1689, partial [Gammaproteobacteria bacterium]|nr:hypothetical protein [Gammaproteobacteria bacterium]
PALIELEKRIKQSLQTRLGLKLFKDEAVNCLDSMGLHFKILAGIREGLTQLEYSYIADDPYNKLMDKSYQDFRVLFDKITEALSSQKPFNLDASTDISEGSSGAAVLASSTGTGHALAESGSAGAAGGVIASNDAPTESPDTVLKKYETELTRIKYSLIKLGSKELIKKIEISSRVGCNPYLRSQSSQVFKLKLPKETQALYFSAEENGSPAPTSGMAELPSSQAVEDQVLGWPIRDISIKNRVGYTLYRLTDTQRTLTTPININEKSLYLKTGYGQTNYTVRIFSVVPFPISLNLSPKFARFEGIVPSLMSNLTMQPVVAVPRPIDSETSLLRFDDSRRVNPYAVEGLPQSDINLIQHAAREALATNPGDIRTSAERGARLALVMTKLTQQGQALEGPSHFQELAGQRQIAMARYNMEQELRSYAAEIHAQEEEIAELKGKLKDSSTQIGALFRELQSKDAVIARLTKRLTKIPGEPGSSESLGWRGAAPLQAAASEGDSDAIKRIWQSVQAGFPFEEPLVGPKQNEAAGTGLTRPLPRTPEAPQASESDALKRAWQNQAVNPFENPSIQKPHSVLHSIAAAGTGLVAGLSPRTPEAPKPPEAPSRLLLPPEAPSRLLPPTP